MSYALTNCEIFTGSELLGGHALIVDAGRIAAIVPAAELPQDLERRDLNGAILSAGFIDLQLNGCGGVLFNSEITEETLATMQAANLRSGTTSYLPTLITSPDEDIKAAVAVTRSYMQKHPSEVLGMHLEGPYTNVQRKGIHPAAQIRPLDDAMVDFLCANADALTKITIAPECQTPEKIRRLKEAGILVSIGHTAATYEQAMASFDAGVGFATHIFNAMTSISNGREPGVVGALFDSGDIYTGIIVDGYHVHWANVRIAHKLLGDRLVLVTDAAAPAGAPEGFDRFDFCGTEVLYRNGRCEDANGTLGGSALTMIEGVENLVKHVGLPLEEALRMATLYPARAIGCDDRLGALAPNMVANLVAFDRNFKVLATAVDGIWLEN